MSALRRCLLLLALVLPLLATAQDMRTIDGRKYAVHVVKAGETLYAIARVYAVPVDALMSANPTAVQGLRIGQEILVPKDAVVRKEAKRAPTLLNDGELRHVVAKKETLFGIARQYGVEMADLMDRNPGITTNLQEGSEVIVPVTKVRGVTAATLRPAGTDAVVDHIVKPGETLFALGQRYGVRPEEIQAANNGLASGLQAGMVVHIPKHAEEEAAVIPEPARPAQQKYHVAFLLPFAATRNDSALEASALTETGPRFYEPSRIAAQFYAGAQIALDSLAARGLVADVTVKDVGDDPHQWSPVLKSGTLSNMDLFIGPFHRSAIEEVTRSHPQARVICPVPQSNKVVLGNPNVSKVAPARSDLAKHSGRYVASRFARENILLVRPDIPAEKELQDQTTTAINSTLATVTLRYRDSVAVVKAGRRDIGDLPSRLDKVRTNVVVVPSEDVEFVANLITKLKPLAKKDSIILVGMEEWIGMDPLSATDLDELGFHFAASSFFDPADPKILRFTQVFRDRFHTDIDEYALLGFDVTYHFLEQLMDQDTSALDTGSVYSPEILHMGFRMGRTGPENGMRNEYAVMVRQRDLKLEKAP